MVSVGVDEEIVYAKSTAIQVRAYPDMQHDEVTQDADTVMCCMI